MTTATSTIPGWVVGTWQLDPTHSEVGFSVRHMMVSKVKGRFATVTAHLTTGESVLDSSVRAEIDMSSVTTGNEQRDADLRGRDYFNAESHPTMTFVSTGVRPDDESYLLDGDLTVHGVTRPVTFDLEIGGVSPDPYGGVRAGFTATGKVNRHDFGMTFDMPMDGGGLVVGDQVTITIEAEFVLDK